MLQVYKDIAVTMEKSEKWEIKMQLNITVGFGIFCSEAPFSKAEVKWFHMSRNGKNKEKTFNHTPLTPQTHSHTDSHKHLADTSSCNTCLSNR